MKFVSSVIICIAASALAVNVTRHWKDIDSSEYVSRVPSGEEVEQWKSAFESANPIKSVDKEDYNYFKDLDHYVTVKDFIMLWHSAGADMDIAQTEWRLLQWDKKDIGTQKGEFAKVTHLRDVIDSLMDYSQGTQWEMTFYAWLWTDFLKFYNKVLLREMGNYAPDTLRTALGKEAAAHDHYSGKEWTAFDKIFGDPEWSGSSFPYSQGMFARESLDAYARANELFLGSLMGEGSLKESAKVFTPEVVQREFTRFNGTIQESEYEGGYSVADKKKALSEEKQAWMSWMSQRAKVSALLSGDVKRAYDAATRLLCREKLILLKNRYNVDDGFCPGYIIPHLASRDWTDKQILAHNLEELILQEQ